MNAGAFARREGTVADVWDCTDSISRSHASFVNVSHHDLEKAQSGQHEFVEAESGNWGTGAMRKSSEKEEAPVQMDKVDSIVHNEADDDL